MPSPTSSSPVSNVGPDNLLMVDALVAGEKWGGLTGSGVDLSFSFPWTSNRTAVFSGPNGGATYSALGEDTATAHFGLSAVQQTAARAALQSWANVADVSFNEIPDTSSSVGDIRFAWTSATQTTSTNSTAWGWASYPNSYWPSAGDVWISTRSSGNSDTNWSAGSGNYEALIHEIGHTLGLKHSFEGTTVLPASLDSKQYTMMSYTEDPHSLFVSLIHNANGSVSWQSHYVEPDTPMLYDVAAIQYIYGANTSYAAGDNVYTFDPATPFIRTLWDGGGNDTISVANFTKGCSIDLQQGHFSRITIESDSTAGYNWPAPPPVPTYDGTDNLAIAFGCVIENAIGGSGADTLTGNDANNSLDGGAGNDTLLGGAGNDSFDLTATARAGNDLFYGGAGDDDFYLDSALDQVVENANQGNDTIHVNFSYSIADLANVENLQAYGGTALTLTGNAQDNLLSGTTGNDVFDGGAGSNTVVYSGSRANYVISRIVDGYTVSSTRDGFDTLKNIEFASFADQVVTLATVTDVVPPTALAFSPADKANGVSIYANLTVTFSEAIQRGAGNIILKNAAGVVLATYDAATSSNLSVAGALLTINPSSDLNYSTGYKVEFAAGSISDLAGNPYAGTASYNFTTTAAPHPVAGTNGNDLLQNRTGGDAFNGGAGLDTVVYASPRANFTIASSATGFVVIDNVGANGTDTLTSVERVKFADVSVALDIAGTGGQAYRIYQAAFGRAPDLGGVGFWMSQMDHGLSLDSVASGFVASTEFTSLYGSNPSHAQIVDKFYLNVLHRAGDPDGVTFWSGVLDSNGLSVAGVLAAFSESAENQVALVGVIGNGFAYTPFG